MKRKRSSNDTRENLITAIGFVFGTFCLALCYNLFLLKNELVVGGVSGLSIVVSKITPINNQVFVYVTNIVLLIACYIFLGRKDTERALIGSLLYPVFITLTLPLANFLEPFVAFQEILITIILTSLLEGMSNGIIYKYGFSTGGGDIIVKILCKYLHLSEGKSLLTFNICIILLGGYVFGVDKAVYAIIILVISSMLVDKICIGISGAKKFMIYTKKIDKIIIIIEKEFKAGYTIFPTVEGYSHKDGEMIMCVIRNRDVNHFKKRLLEVDKESFYVVSDCYEVQGGIRRSNLPFIK